MSRHRTSAVETERLRKYRPDIQGLRAVAIMMVVSMHCGILDIHGGVDVSFVLSGFLIGSQLFAEIDKTGKVSLTKFWARRFRRIAPAMAITIISTAVLSWIFVSPFRFREYMSDGLAASLSVINWRLAENGTDYFANDGSQSPYQHFWSLGIEEQFYVVAPVALVVLVWLSRTLFRNRVLVALFLMAVVAGSFYLGYTTTPTNQPLAYFSTHTRIWELAFGVLLALNAPLLSRMNTAVAGFLTWVGLATALVTAMLITEHTPLPGYAVAGPLLGASLIIAGGCAAPRLGAERLLDNPVFDFIGNISYGWYLWHWPVLILWPSIIGREFTFQDRLRVAVLSFLLAIAMHYVVEKRFRESVKLTLSPWRGIFTGGALTSSAAACTALALYVVPLNLPLATSGGSAAALGFEGTESVKQAVSKKNSPEISESALLEAPGDRGDHGCIDDLLITSFTLRDECVIGDTEADRTMVLLGDSHAYQWGNAFNELGRELNVKVITVIKSGCTPEVYKITREDLGREYTECVSWRKTALEQIAKIDPDVIAVTNRVQATTTRDGATETFEKLEATGADLVYLTDTPYPNFSVPDCLAKGEDNLPACSPKSENVIDRAEFRAMEREVAEEHGAEVIDTIPAFCADGYCPAVIGGHVVYWDYSHMSGSYSKSLAPYLRPTFEEVLGKGKA
ncbi:acyltransferase family protein [Streptomyces sp. NPDC052023]|uniref:acyltransferase family protein n=1 Tax=Streptomyces sp. NPDC052023 TaxID=3365681 RepID=UPI0037D5CC3B